MNRTERRKALRCRHPQDGADWCNNCFGLMHKIPVMKNNGKNIFNIGFMESMNPYELPKPDYSLVGKPIPEDHELYILIK